MLSYFHNSITEKFSCKVSILHLDYWHCFSLFVKCKTDSWGRIAEILPEDWPFWCNPDYSQIEKEIKADPRWEKWVRQCQDR